MKGVHFLDWIVSKDRSWLASNVPLTADQQKRCTPFQRKAIRRYHRDGYAMNAAFVNDQQELVLSFAARPRRIKA